MKPPWVSLHPPQHRCASARALLAHPEPSGGAHFSFGNDPRREQAGCDPILAVPSHHTSWDPHPWAKGWELTENPLGSLLGEKFCLFGPKQSKDELMWISLRPVLTWTLKVAAGTCQGPAVLSQGKCSTVCLGALMFPPQGHAQPHTNVSAFSSAFLPVSDPLFCSRDLVCDGFPGTEVPTG